MGRAFGPEGKGKSRFPSGMTKMESEGQRGRVKGKREKRSAIQGSFASLRMTKVVGGCEF
jgi:hypothetical protein